MSELVKNSRNPERIVIIPKIEKKPQKVVIDVTVPVIIHCGQHPEKIENPPLVRSKRAYLTVNVRSRNRMPIKIPR